MSARVSHYLLLVATSVALTFPNLGTPSLWDMDEGVNAECTREMMESGTWVIPTFNWDLRTAKPILLYWIQRPFFAAFGPTEIAARLPAALLGLLSVLLVYELGRRMFDPATGLLSGIAIASAVQFCILSHAATPDAPLIFFSTATFLGVWFLHENGGRNWLVWPAIPCALAVLTKGPIGLALPGLTVLLYLAWNRELYRALDRRLIWGGLLWAAVALPWYIVVTAETHGEYLKKFLGHENMNRFANPQEGHRGPVFFYVICVFALFAPWCCMLPGAIWYGVRNSRKTDEPTNEARANRFLLCWAGSYIAFFSLAATKLPNYIAPAYPALAILMARFLVLWQSGRIAPARWVMPLGASGVAIVGGAFAIGMQVAGGAVPVPAGNMRIFPGLAPWAAIGLIPILGAAGMAWGLLRGNRTTVVASLTGAAVAFVGAMATGPALVVDRYKAAKDLVNESGAYAPDREVRLGAAEYFQESLVFYSQRRVERLPFATAADFLESAHHSFLFVPESVWTEKIANEVSVPCRVVAKKYDFYRNAVILVVSNR